MDKSKQENTSIILLADNFDQQLLPLIKDCPWASRRFASKQILDLALEWISQIDVPNIIVASSSLDLHILETFKKKWEDCFKTFVVLHFPDRKSVGDIMRAIDQQNLVSGDFILIDNPATFSSSNLSKQISNFRKLRNKNKRENLMSLVYSQNDRETCQTIGFFFESGKLVLYNSREDIPTYSLPKALFKTDSCVRSDLSPSGIAFCALDILPLFSDNFDFQDLDDVIRDILVNEELHIRHIYVDVLSEKEYDKLRDKKIYSDYTSLIRCHRLLIQRWCFPLVFDFVASDSELPRLNYSMHQNIYSQAGQKWPETAKNSIFGQNCRIEHDDTIDNCSFGDFAIIGPSSSLNNIVAGDNLKVGKNCQLNESILGDNVILEDGIQIKQCCFIGSNVKIPSCTTISSYSIICSHPPDEDDEDIIKVEEENGYYKWYSMIDSRGRFWRSSRRTLSPSLSRSRERSRTYSGRSSKRESSPTVPTGPIDVLYGTDNVIELFSSEVKDSMNGILGSENHASKEILSKLILEINSSKLSWNISMDNVAKYVFASFLTLPPVKEGLKGFKKLFKEWLLIWTNYYKPKQSQLQMLHAIEERSAEQPTFQRIVPNIVHFIFNDMDILNEDVILDWYSNLPSESPLKESLKQLIDWIESASEEEDSDSDKEN